LGIVAWYRVWLRCAIDPGGRTARASWADMTAEKFGQKREKRS